MEEPILNSHNKAEYSPTSLWRGKVFISSQTIEFLQRLRIIQYVLRRSMITELLKTFAERLFGMSISQDAQSIMYFTIYSDKT